MDEQNHVQMEAERSDQSDSYFMARPQVDTPHNRKLFEAGFERGFKADRKPQNTTSIHHELKLDDVHYPYAESQEKMFEIRLNDRHYKVGDTLTLNRWNRITSEYMGESLERVIIYITDFQQKPGYVVLGLREI